MTILQIHLLMAVLGGLVCVVLAGRFPLGSQAHAPRWTLGLIAGVTVAITPLSRFWREHEFTADLLAQSLLLAAISVLAFLLLLILRKPPVIAALEPALDATGEQIEAVLEGVTTPDDAIHTTPPVPDLPVIVIDATKSRQSIPAIMSLATQSKQDSQPLDVQADELNLEETEVLFAQLREQSLDVELPDSEEWTSVRADMQTELGDLDDSVVLDERDFPLVEADTLAEDISDADFTEQVENSPAPAKPEQVVKIIPTPATLDGALKSAKQSAVKLHNDVLDLESGLLKITEHRSADELELDSDQLYLARLAMRHELILKAETSTREAAEAIITAQRELITKTSQRQTLATALLSRERKRLAAQKLEITRSRQMARDATLLARKAATAQQAIRDIARREQEARVRSQESTRKAVDIARNAINALAAEERKKSGIRH